MDRADELMRYFAPAVVITGKSMALFRRSDRQGVVGGCGQIVMNGAEIGLRQDVLRPCDVIAGNRNTASQCFDNHDTECVCL